MSSGHAAVAAFMRRHFRHFNAAAVVAAWTLAACGPDVYVIGGQDGLGSGAGNTGVGTSTGSGVGTGTGGSGTAGTGSTGTGTGGTGAAGGTGGSGASAGTGGTGGTVEICADLDDPCTECISLDCPASWCGCTDNPECFALFDCYGGCLGLPGCQEQCLQLHADGISSVGLVSGCAGTTCSHVCTWGEPDFDDCAACAYQDCSAEVNACLADPPCNELRRCFRDCGHLDLVCQQQCYADYPDGVVLLQSMWQCLDDLCPACQ